MCDLQVQGPHHPSAAAAFPQAQGIADVDYGQRPGAGAGGDQRWKAPVLPPVDEPAGKRRLEWTRECMPVLPPPVKGALPAGVPRRLRHRSAPYAGRHTADFGPHLVHTPHPFLDAGPSQRKWNIAWEMVLLVLAWLGVTIAYVVVRATKSLHLGPATAYGVWVLVMEALGATTLVIYSIHLCVRIRKFTPPPVSGERAHRCQHVHCLSTSPVASARQEGTQPRQVPCSAQALSAGARQKSTYPAAVLPSGKTTPANQSPSSRPRCPCGALCRCILALWHRCARHGACLSLAACWQVRNPFSVRVMVPCYKEDIETLDDTLTAAVKAAKLAMDADMANAGQLQCSRAHDKSAPFRLAAKSLQRHYLEPSWMRWVQRHCMQRGTT